MPRHTLTDIEYLIIRVIVLLQIRMSQSFLHRDPLVRVER